MKSRSRSLGIPAGLLCTGSIAVVAFHTTLSPLAYHRRGLEPAIEVGEELFGRCKDYRQELGSYPASIGVMYFPRVDHCKYIEGVR